MSKPALKVAFVGEEQTAINAVVGNKADIVFYARPDLDCTYCVLKFQTEERLPRKHELAPPMGNWRTAFPVSRGKYPTSVARLYKKRASYVEMVDQLRKHFEIEEVKVE